MNFETPEDVLEHFGVKGQRWGVRRKRAIQKNLDRTARIREGTATRRDKFDALRFGTPVTRGGARRTLARGARHQTRVAQGNAVSRAILTDFGHLRLSELNFHQ